MRESLTNSRETVRKLVIGCISILGLLGAGTGKAEAQDVTPPGEEAVNNTRERNLKALRAGEYLVLDKVMAILNQVYTIFPTGLGLKNAFGYYLDQDGLKLLLSQKAKFDEKIKELNLSESEMSTLEEMFKIGNIIFGHRSINDPNFMGLLWHERIHKYMAEDLSAEEKRLLNGVKDFFMHNFSQSTSSIEPIFKVGNPGTFSKFQLDYIVNAKTDDFWSILAEGNFTNVESYIAEHFPEASAIYKRMKTKATAEKK